MSVVLRCRLFCPRASPCRPTPRRPNRRPRRRSMSSSRSTARSISRSGSAAARWPRAPARPSPISCPAFTCCRRRRASAIPAPGQKSGKSNVGFAASKQEVAARLEQIWLARLGRPRHRQPRLRPFRRRRLEQGRLASEFRIFRAIVRERLCDQRHRRRAGRLAAVRRQPRSRAFARPICRPARRSTRRLPDAGYCLRRERRVARPGPAAEPTAASNASRCRRFREGPSRRRVIAMDYNMFVRHSGGFERADKAAVFENRAFDAFQAAFDAEYQRQAHAAAARLPFHADERRRLLAGARALRRRRLRKPDVACISYRDYIARNAPPERRPADGQRGRLSRVSTSAGSGRARSPLRSR